MAAQSDLHERQIQHERRFQSIILSTVAALLIGYATWAGGKLMSLSESAAIAAEKLQVVDLVVKTMYRADDAKRDVSAVTDKIDRNSLRIDANTRRIDGLDVRVHDVEKKKN